MSERDRDGAGHARNARPRDALGRPLPYGSTGVPPLPEATLAPAQALQEAQRLLDDGLPFQAHEVLEAAWKAAPDDERDLWQGLAQLAVALTHARRGNRPGAIALLRRGSDNVARHTATPPYGVDVRGLLGWAETSSTLLAADRAVPDPPRLQRS